MRKTLHVFGWIGVLLGGAGRSDAAVPATVSPQVREEPVWIYPWEAERAGLRQGQVRAMLSISETGELLDYLVTGCSHAAFADAVTKALPEYRFTPARVRGEPKTVRFPVTFHFSQGGGIVSLMPDDAIERQLAGMNTRDTFLTLICPQSRLDRPLAPVHVVSPRYPAELRSEGTPGEVTVEFFVDGTGRVRMPAVETDVHPSFAREAVAALLEWRFEPPTSGGQPALVKVEQSFRFAPPPRG